MTCARVSNDSTWIRASVGVSITVCLIFFGLEVFAGARSTAQGDTGVIDGHGTAYITRIIPLPTTVSPEARKLIGHPGIHDEGGSPPSLAQMRTDTDAWQAHMGGIAETMYPVHIARDMIDGVPVRVVTPIDVPAHIAIYGTSAGATLTAEVALRLKQLGLPLPAALGIFSGFGDFSRNGDSAAMYGLGGVAGVDPPGKLPPFPNYVGAANPEDPMLSPVYTDLRGLPPTLFITSARATHRPGWRPGVPPWSPRTPPAPVRAARPT